MHRPAGTLVLLLVLVLGSCSSEDGSSGAAEFDVTTTTISHEDTREISVWAPDAEGPWPIVYALHGLGGRAEDLAVLAEEVASHGVVVFATDYSTDDPVQGERDAECGSRYVLSVAEDHGGDLDQPMTLVGHSLGASAALIGGLDEAAYGPGGSFQECFSGRAMFDVIVPISGCHYEFEGERSDLDVSGYGNTGAEIVLVAGTDDTVCPAWQSRDAVDALRAAGYDAELVEIDGANHLQVIFHDMVDDEFVTVPDSPAGHDVVRAIVDAIDAAQE